MRKTLKTKLDRFGRVLIPKPVRDRHGLKPGDTLEIEEIGDEVRLTSEAFHGTPIEKNGLLVWTGKLPEGYDVREHLDRLYAERERDILGGDRT